MAFRPHPRRLECLIACRYHSKGSTVSPQLFKDPECGSGLGLEPRPSVQYIMPNLHHQIIFVMELLYATVNHVTDLPEKKTCDISRSPKGLFP